MGGSNDDTTNILVEVTTGEGVTAKLQLPPTATVLMVKQEVESELGIRPREACVFSSNVAHTEKLPDEELLASLFTGGEVKLELLLLVEQADAQQVVPELPIESSIVLGDGIWSHGDTQLGKPAGAAFIAAHPDWVVTTERIGHRIKISNIRTGALVCQLGGHDNNYDMDDLVPFHTFGRDEDQFYHPKGVAVTSDSSFVIVADSANHRVQVLRLIVGADGISAHFQFECSLGSGKGTGEGQINVPLGVTLLQSNGGQQETVLVTEQRNHRVSQFTLDGTFIGVFAGTGKAGNGNGEFDRPQGITVLASSGEVAVADRRNQRVQIFDSQGNYKRQFGGTEGKEAGGHLHRPSGLASDAHGNLLVVDKTNRLQVFDPEGKHLCTRSDLGMHDNGNKGIAWSTGGEIAVANGGAHNALVWRTTD
jgi:DNA-binding beta-propeller fold protein YncE